MRSFRSDNNNRREFRAADTAILLGHFDRRLCSLVNIMDLGVVGPRDCFNAWELQVAERRRGRNNELTGSRNWTYGRGVDLRFHLQGFSLLTDLRSHNTQVVGQLILFVDAVDTSL